MELADDIWGIVQDLKTGSATSSPRRLGTETPDRGAAAHDSSRSKVVREVDTEKGGEAAEEEPPWFMLEKVAGSDPKVGTKTARTGAPDRADRAKPIRERSVSALSHSPDSGWELGKVKGKKAFRITPFKRVYETWEGSWIKSKAGVWWNLESYKRLPLGAQWLIDNVYLLRRPSLLQNIPTALVHFAIVESASLFFVGLAWFNIVYMRLCDLWLNSRHVSDLVDCSQAYATRALLSPAVMDMPYECHALGYPNSTMLSMWNVPNMEVCDETLAFQSPDVSAQVVISMVFYVPLSFLILLVAYRCASFIATCGVFRPMSFASGQYILFTWMLPRNKIHRNLLRITLMIFVFAFIFVVVHSYTHGVGIESGSRTAMALNVLILLDKLADLGKGEVPQHSFQKKDFFSATVFKRSWLALFTESSYRFSTRLMDALWKFTADDKTGLREMLENGDYKPEDAEYNSSFKFFERCEHAQRDETADKDKEEQYAVHDEELEAAAKMMFGDFLIDNIESDPAAVMRAAMDMKEEADAELERTNEENRRLHAVVVEAKAEAEQARKDKEDAIKRAVQSEQELAQLRALGERLMMREKECILLKEEVQGSQVKDAQLIKLMDENTFLKEGASAAQDAEALAPAVPSSGASGSQAAEALPLAVPSGASGSQALRKEPAGGVGDTPVLAGAGHDTASQRPRKQGLLGTSLTPSSEGNLLSNFRRTLNLGPPSHLGNQGVNDATPPQV